jgi:hypothetical protein
MMLDIARSLPCHFILTAHWLVIEYDDQINKKKFIMRQLVTAGKKIAAKVPIYFDEMYYFGRVFPQRQHFPFLQSST